MTSDILQARRLGRSMVAISVFGTIIAVGAWATHGFAAAASVYLALLLTLAALLAIGVGLRAPAPDLGARGTAHGLIGGRKTSR